MKEEFDLNEPDNEGKPGSLGNAFDGFSPDLPEGSWERLAERRKKRRRLPIWWWLPALLLLSGLGNLYFGNSTSSVLDEQPQEIVLQSEAGNTQMEKAQSSSTEAGKDQASTPRKNPSASVPKETVETDRNTKAIESYGSKEPITRPSAAESKPETTRVDSKIEVKEKSPKQRTVPVFAGSDIRVPKAGMKRRNTPKENTVVTASKVSSKPKAEILSTKDKGIAITRNPDEPGTTELAKSEPVRSKKIASADPVSEEKAPVAVGKKITDTDNADVEQTNIQPVKRPTEKEVIQKVEEKENVAETALINPVVAMKEPTDTVVQKPKVFDADTVAKVDSTLKKQAAKLRFGMEAGISGLVVSQDLTTTTSIDYSEVRVQKPEQVGTMWGGSVHLKLRIPVSERWTLLPVAEFSILSQTFKYLEVAGAQGPVKLIKTADGISGSPRNPDRTYTVNRWILMPSAGLEIAYQLFPKFGIRAGANIAWTLPKNGSADNPVMALPSYVFALEYEVRKNWMIRLDLREFEFKRKALPATVSSSRNLQLGLGLVWKPW